MSGEYIIGSERNETGAGWANWELVLAEAALQTLTQNQPTESAPVDVFQQASFPSGMEMATLGTGGA